MAAKGKRHSVSKGKRVASGGVKPMTDGGSPEHNTVKRRPVEPRPIRAVPPDRGLSILTLGLLGLTLPWGGIWLLSRTEYPLSLFALVMACITPSLGVVAWVVANRRFREMQIHAADAGERIDVAIGRALGIVALAMWPVVLCVLRYLMMGLLIVAG